MQINKTLLLYLFFGTGIVIFSSFTYAQVIVFPTPEGMVASEDYQLKVDNKQVFCYSTFRIDNTHPTTKKYNTPVSPLSFAIFDFSGSVNIKITPRPDLIENIEKLMIRPLSLNIKPSWNGKELSFQLNKPADITIDLQGDGMHALHLFTNFPETDIPDPDDPNVLYYGPGIHEVDQIKLKSDQTLYLAGGAVLLPNPKKIPELKLVLRGIEYVRGESMVQIYDAHNVIIRGRGIISAARSISNGTKAQIIRAADAENISFHDILLLDANAWNLHMNNCEDAIVDNIRILGYYTNSDGVCFNCCRNSVARNCFVHICDDSYEVKAMDPELSCHDILFENCTAWNDFGASMGVTHEVAGEINRVIWQNITVLRYNNNVHDNWLLHRAPIFIHAVGGGKVSNLSFENIHIEMTDTKQAVILIDNMNSEVPQGDRNFGKPYNKIWNLKFKNIYATNISTPKIILVDDSENGYIKDICFENVIFNGAKIVPDDPRLEIKFAKRVKVFK